ncbi:MAG: class I tRNA ligase family protein, partial [Patescibacteria group bacterium]
VSDGERFYILAHQALERYQDGSLEVVEYIPGKKLLGEAYEPLFDYVSDSVGQDFTIYAGDFVSMDEGTGIVHIAPGFGEDDTALGEKNGLTTVITLDDEGHFLPIVKDWAGKFYRAANEPIIENLRQRHHLFRQKKISHSYPHCYRCDTPLIYKSQVSWYMKIDQLRKDLKAKNKEINWVPQHFGTGRFKHNLESAPDWSLSRTRYWGTPIPVWETKDGELFVPESVAELEKLSGQKIDDLHRPAIDQVELKLPNGQKAKRVKEVLDVWFESGSMPYAQDHYPFSGKKEFAQHHPADFIIEYTGQLRGWFYYLHVLSNALFGKNAFKNVVVTGVLMGNDGRKMSKSYGNYPDPKGIIEKYGGEALRLYFLTSKIMGGEDTAIAEDEIRDQSRLLNVLQNSAQYYLTYRSLFKPGQTKPKPQLLDRWIVARTKELERQIDTGLATFDFQSASKEIRPYIEDLSTWYIRSNRDRFVGGDEAALQTLGAVLKRFAVAIAPILPFSAERIYQILGGEKESVHLVKFPSTSELASNDKKLVDDMAVVREICSAGNMLRSQAGISLRQPLTKLVIEGKTVVGENKQYRQIVADELNVKAVELGQPKTKLAEHARVGDNIVYLDIKLTHQLRQEGELRELLRNLQAARKKAGLNVGEKVTLQYSSDNKELNELISTNRKAIIAAGSFLAVEKVEDSPGLQQLTPDGLKFGFKR